MLGVRWGALLGLAAMGAAVTVPALAQAQRAPVNFAPTRAVLVLIPGAEATQALAAHRPGSIDAASAAEAELLRDCADGEAQRPQVQKGFLWDVVVRAWRVMLHPVAVSVRDELLKYASVSEAAASADYYRAAGAGAGTTGIDSHISCLRFTRFRSPDPGDEEVALDFIASLRLDTPRDAIRLRPLRLFVSQAAAKSATGRYAVAISLRVDAVWRDEFAGHRGQVFEETLVRESVDLHSGSFLKYYAGDAARGRRVPIIPISFEVDRTHDFGHAEFEVSVAELGTPPATLTLLSEMLPDPDEKLSRLLIDAALAGTVPQ